MKYKILKILKENPEKPVSGEELSKILGVSRTTVWKQIALLLKEGYDISAASKSGYKLNKTEGLLNSYEIGCELGTEIIGKHVLYCDSIGSTNTEAVRIAVNGGADGTTVVALQQTAGRGRLGREWFSPPDAGIYISIILKPQAAPADMNSITAAAALATVDAIKECTGMQMGIKWPNDVIAGGRKLCGILTEMNTELDRINHIVLGVGLNYSQKAKDFPDNLRDIAISLSEYAKEQGMEMHCGRLDIIRSFLRHMDKYYVMILSGNTSPVLSAWKAASVNIGKEVRLIYKNKEATGYATDITGDAKLVVRLDSGETVEISSGEVSVRGLLGYC